MRRLSFENLEHKLLLTTLFVNSRDDSGPGTFRQAIETANNDPEVSIIRFKENGNFFLDEPVVYSGSQSLTINGTTLDRPFISPSASNQQEQLLIVNGGGNLRLNKMTLRNSDLALQILVPAAQSDDYRLVLNETHFRGNSRSIEIKEESQLVDGDEVFAESGMFLRFSRVFVESNEVNQTKQIYLEENGAGNVIVNLTGTNAQVRNNALVIEENGEGNVRLVARGIYSYGRDPIQVSEGGSGRVYANIRNSNFENPTGIAKALQFSENEAGNVSVVVSDSRFDSFSPAIDLDEHSVGNLDFRFTDSVVQSSSGLTATENDNGSISVVVRDVDFFEGSVGVSVVENGNGNLATEVTNAVFTGYQQGNVVLREFGIGNVNSKFSDIYTNINFANNPPAGAISVHEEGVGSIKSHVDSVFLSGVEDVVFPAFGLELQSLGFGKIDATVVDSAFKDVITGIIAKQDEDDAIDEFGTLALVGDVQFRTETDTDLTAVNLA